MFGRAMSVIGIVGGSEVFASEFIRGENHRSKVIK